MSIRSKQEILAAYDRLDRSEKGALLRRGPAYRQLASRDRRIAELEAEKAALAAELQRAHDRPRD